MDSPKHKTVVKTFAKFLEEVCSCIAETEESYPSDHEDYISWLADTIADKGGRYSIIFVVSENMKDKAIAVFKTQNLNNEEKSDFFTLVCKYIRHMRLECDELLESFSSRVSLVRFPYAPDVVGLPFLFRGRDGRVYNLMDDIEALLSKIHGENSPMVVKEAHYKHSDSWKNLQAALEDMPSQHASASLPDVRNQEQQGSESTPFSIDSTCPTYHPPSDSGLDQTVDGDSEREPLEGPEMAQVHSYGQKAVEDPSSTAPEAASIVRCITPSGVESILSNGETSADVESENRSSHMQPPHSIGGAVHNMSIPSGFNNSIVPWESDSFSGSLNASSLSASDLQDWIAPQDYVDIDTVPSTIVGWYKPPPQRGLDSVSTCLRTSGEPFTVSANVSVLPPGVSISNVRYGDQRMTWTASSAGFETQMLQSSSDIRAIVHNLNQHSEYHTNAIAADEMYELSSSRKFM